MSTLQEFELIKEKEFQRMIAVNETIRKGIAESIYDDANTIFEFNREVEFINGITSDFIMSDQNKEIVSIIECKRPDIGVTEYVRGIGQLFQYEYFYENNITPRRLVNYTFKENTINSCNFNFKNALVIPSTFIQNTSLNISLFKYPETSIIIEVNLNNYNVRKIDRGELNRLARSENNMVAISQYYLRDNRIFEYYIALNYVQLWHAKNPRNRSNFNRVDAEQFLRSFDTINNGNWRNAFISLASLGFIDSSNKLTTSGRSMVSLSLEEFIFKIYNDYIYPYVNILMELFIDEPRMLLQSNRAISNRLKECYNGKDILYLTESEGRYISSWLNIMRDDLGCINFRPRKQNREIIYRINHLQEEIIKINITRFNSASTYVEAYYDLVEGV